MKQVKIYVLTLLLLSFTVALQAQSNEVRNLSSFSEIRVGQAIELELIKGNTEKAEIYARGIDLDEIITDVSGGRLRIKIDRDRLRSVEVRIKLTYKSLRGIGISSAADVYSRSTITADDLYLDVSSAGNGDFQLNVKSLEAEVSSAGSLELRGTVEDVRFSVSSAGSIRAFDLECKEVDARASSAGSVRVFATLRLDARASSGGSIRYKGNPDKQYTNASSGGSIRKY